MKDDRITKTVALDTTRTRATILEDSQVIEIFIGFCMAVIALLPKGKFYPGRLGTKQVLPPIEPAWIGRLFIGGVGLAAILDGIWRMRHH